MSAISKVTLFNEQLLHKLVDSEALLDPAEYLFQQTKYHDCVFTVGDPSSGCVEKIGVVSSHLAARSTVFRALLEDPKRSDPSNLVITNASPEVFKLMLRYMYGGDMAEITQSTAGQLALCADMYNIQPLVSQACKRLVPASVSELFPALWCVAYVSCPELEPHVTKMIQEETEAVLDSKEFLELDSQCVSVIAHQERLAVTELQLWRALVRWAQNKVQGDSIKSVREHLQTVLQFVRLTTLSQDEIIKEVLPSYVLTAAEGIDLLTAVTSNLPWQLDGLCALQSARQMAGSSLKEKGTHETFTEFKQSTIFKNTNSFDELPEYQSTSNLTITTVKDTSFEIESFTFKSRAISKQGNKPIYKLSCSVTVSKIEKGFCKETQTIQVGGSVVGSEDIAFPIKLRNGQPLRLAADSWYNVALEFSDVHPVFQLRPYNRGVVDEVTSDGIKVKFNTSHHIKNITYKFPITKTGE